MKRVFGAVSGALRSLAPKARPPAVVHQERVRDAMEALAPKGYRLPSESKSLAMEVVAASEDRNKELPLKTPEDMYQAANAFHFVRSSGGKWHIYPHTRGLSWLTESYV